MLEDIYKMDPSLREKESELAGILSDILKSKPDMRPDTDFVKELRGKLLSSAKNEASKKVWGPAWNYKKFLLPIGSLTTVVLVLAIFWGAADGLKMSSFNKNKVSSISSKVAVLQLEENAFGALSSLSASNSNASGGGQESLNSTGMDKSFGAPEGRGGDSSISVYPYEPTYYVYVYKGGEVAQGEAKLNVLRRMADSSSIDASVLTSRLNFGLFNLGKLNSAKTASLSFYEDREFGYRTDIDLSRGSVSIYKNWEKWPNPFASCVDENCYRQASIKLSDLPGDQEIISKSNEFLNSYSIDMSAYGAPEINKNFFSYYAENPEMSLPDEISIVYPLQVEGKNVYESYGDINGLNVSYDIRHKRASSIYNLMTHTYQGSAYEAETDFSKIIEAARNVDGVMPLMRDKDVSYKTIEIELDTPFIAYANFWRYENNQSSEYLVPAMIFPVKGPDDPSRMYARKRVVVPLIKEFLNRNDEPVTIMGESMEIKN